MVQSSAIRDFTTRETLYLTEDTTIFNLRNLSCESASHRYLSPLRVQNYTYLVDWQLSITDQVLPDESIMQLTSE